MPSELPDLYAVLGLPRTSTIAEIRARYRKLIKEEHPDRFAGERARAVSDGDPERIRQIDARMAQAEQRSRLLNLAHEILCNPRKRQQYDRGQPRPQARPSDPMRQPPRPPQRPPNPPRPGSSPQGPAHLIFDRTVIDFGIVKRDQQLVRFIRVDNLGGRPTSFTVDWAQRYRWAGFDMQGNPGDTFPVMVRVRINTTGLNYGHYRLALVVTADGRTYNIPVIVHVQDPARPPVSTDWPTSSTSRRSNSEANRVFMRIGAVPFIVALLTFMVPIVLNRMRNTVDSLSRPGIYLPTPIRESLAMTLTQWSVTTQPTAAKHVTPRPSATPLVWPTITPTANPIDMGIPSGWQTVSAETIADDANWRPSPKTPFVIDADAKLSHYGDTFQWVLPAWEAHEWWLTLPSPGNGKDLLISARMQVISGEPVGYGLVTSYENEKDYSNFIVDTETNSYVVGKLLAFRRQKVASGALPEGVDPANLWLTVLMVDRHLSYMVDGVVVYESDLPAPNDRIGFYVTVAPYTKVTLSFDNITIATR